MKMGVDFLVSRESVMTAEAEVQTDIDIEQERLQRKQELAAAFRIFGRFGFSEGVAGHITARDPEFPDRFWVNPYGTHFGRMTMSDLICVDHHGELVEGSLSGSNVIN